MCYLLHDIHVTDTVKFKQVYLLIYLLTYLYNTCAKKIRFKLFCLAIKQYLRLNTINFMQHNLAKRDYACTYYCEINYTT